jgi:putative spermidine/putrescine transport system permease protein
LTAENDITLPLEIAGMTDSVTAPRLYALGTLMTGFSFVLMLVPLLAARILARKR